MAQMIETPLILHHYGFSSFSEKIRLVLGLKRLAWRGVVIPSVAPKPKLTPLTGGYRHTPVLQIGADIYCDTRLIAREIDRRYPEPPLCPPHLVGHAYAIEAWAERDFFWPLARYVSGLNADLTPEMNADRAALRGKQPPSVDRLRRVAHESFNLVETQIPRIEAMLSDGRQHILGDAPTIADFAVYHGLWFLSAMPVDCSGFLHSFPHILAWMARIRAIGHGSSHEIAADDALQIAKAAIPEPVRISSPAAFDLPVGTHVSIRPDDYTTEAVSGTLVYTAPDEIAVRRHDAHAGDVVVHFPRIGSSIRAIP